MSDILKKILATKAQEVSEAKAKGRLAIERAKAEQSCTSKKPFAQTLISDIQHLQQGVIAEIKKASPSKGVIRADFNPASLAQAYQAAGASCLSILTDQLYFQGHLDDLVVARQACTLPLLRKDFMVDAYQVYEAAAAGADCILLIVAALDIDQMRDLEQLAYELGMSVLVESHDAYELEQALSLKTPLIGINNRNLKTFDVRLETTLSLLKEIPQDRVVITESGILNAQDVMQMKANGVYGFLVGEAMMREPDIGVAFSNLFQAG